MDCGTGTDIARQDLVDDQGDLDIDGCETIETTALDQRAMTQIRRIARLRGGRLRLSLACPRRSRVACRGTAALANSPTARPRRGARYRMRKGGRARLVLVGRGRYVVLTEKDQRGRLRRVARRR